MRTIELLAPAKDYEQGCAAIDCGADALYVGAPGFGARRGAAVDAEQIGRLCDYAHRFGVRVFVTMNTLVFEDELRQAEAMARAMVRCGADALIVQDTAFLRMDLPQVELHASTQMFNMDAARAKFWSNAGFTRIIIERASSLDEIAQIAAAAPDAEIEAFVHGAICVGYSGRCFMSRSMGPRSGNRGDCMQACRLPYDLVDGDGNVLLHGKHLLSVQDLNLSARLDAMIDAGVCSFKIEGRLKDMNYVRNVVTWYRRLLDAVIEGRNDLCRASEGLSHTDFAPDPAKSFSRGATEYYLDGPRCGVASFDTPKSLGEPVGTVSAVGRDFFRLTAGVELAAGDGICFAGPDGLSGTNVNRAEGDRVWPNRMDGIRSGIEIFRNDDHRFNTALARSRVRRTIPVAASVAIDLQRIVLTFSDGCSEATVVREGRFDAAQNPQRAEDTIRAQVSKTGDTIYTVNEVTIRQDVSRFMPVSLLNELRREGVAKLDRARAEHYRSRRRREEDTDAVFPQPELSGEENVVNSLARAFYADHGVQRVEPGYDMADSLCGRRVMRMRYCLRRETGQCLREGATHHGLLFIEHGPFRYELRFDCTHCEMSVICPDEQKQTTKR